MGFEPTTPTLARLCSTPELRPHQMGSFYGGALNRARGKMQKSRFFFMPLHASVIKQHFASPWRPLCPPARQNHAPPGKEGKP